MIKKIEHVAVCDSCGCECPAPDWGRFEKGVCRDEDGAIWHAKREGWVEADDM